MQVDPRLMREHGIIVGYVSLWMGWSSLVGLAFRSRQRPTTWLDARTSVLIPLSAFLPLAVLSLGAYYTRWMPTEVKEMLSCMTPILFAVFVLQRIGELPVPSKTDDEKHIDR